MLFIWEREKGYGLMRKDKIGLGLGLGLTLE